VLLAGAGEFEPVRSDDVCDATLVCEELGVAASEVPCAGETLVFGWASTGGLIAAARSSGAALASVRGIALPTASTAALAAASACVGVDLLNARPMAKKLTNTNASTAKPIEMAAPETAGAGSKCSSMRTVLMSRDTPSA
jgi:hypothetical protein